MRFLLPFLVLTLVTSAASAQALLPTEGPRNAVTTSLVAPLDRGVAFGYERALLGSHLGLVSHLGMRFPELGDFRTRGYGFGVELRWYALGRTAGKRRALRSIVGFFLYLREGYTITSVREDGERQVLGRSHRLTSGLGLGYRFMLGPRVEFTPTLGFDMRTDFVSGLASSSRPTAVLGFTMGVLFDRRFRTD
jgi:hypothetical protein